MPIRTTLNIVKSIFENIKVVFGRIANIAHGTDVEGTIENIRKDIYIKGSNIWILICSTMLASIGLDINSTAVIIGAMLISPLMSPILGIGLAVGINDRLTLVQSLRNFSYAIIISLLTAFLYFLISPLGEPTSELISRTTPTLLDVLVAFFGGVAGIVAGSRREKTTAIPGVAIATALMPPLCTAGFGLATGRMDFFFGAFYLFFINAAFIATATYLIVRFLKFPFHEFVDPIREKKVKRWMAIFSILIITPSIYFLYTVIVEVKLKKDVNRFAIEYLEPQDIHIVDWRLVDRNDTVCFIDMTIRGKHLEENELKLLELAFEKQVVRKPVQFNQLSDMSVKEMDKIADEIREEINNELSGKQNLFNEVTIENNMLKRELYEIKTNKLPVVKIYNEVTTLFPDIEKFAISKVVQVDRNDTIPTVILKWKKISNSTRIQNEKRLTDFLLKRLELDTIQIVKY